jgi:toxin ParE1/3/4
VAGGAKEDVGLVSAGFELAPKALEDLRTIWTFIAVENHNPIAADQLVAAIEKACARLAGSPSLGHARSDLTPNPELLFYCVRDYYLVIYRKETSPLQIVRVFHGARDVEEELGDM